MAIEKVGVYRKWLEPVPKDKNGEPIPESEWPRKRRHRWIARWYGTNDQRYGKVFEKRKEAQKFASTSLFHRNDLRELENVKRSEHGLQDPK